MNADLLAQYMNANLLSKHDQARFHVRKAPLVVDMMKGCSYGCRGHNVLQGRSTVETALYDIRQSVKLLSVD